jgi:phosphatidylglycerophosphate synthase
MSSSPTAEDRPAQGRPVEIEEWLNRVLIHPLSRRLVTVLIPTGVTPNMVSVMGVVMAAIAAGLYGGLPWPVSALLGFVAHLGWHVFDGADGDLARRTGKSSPSGEVVDGICDYLSHVVIYLVLAMILAGQFRSGQFGDISPAWAWVLAILAGLSRAVQANHYESSRRTYQWWVYGMPWIRQGLSERAAETGPATPWDRIRTGLGGSYLAISRLVTPDDSELEPLRARLLTGPKAPAMRQLYAEAHKPLLKRAGWLGALHETQAIFLSMLAMSPLWVFIYILVALNGLMLVSISGQKRANHKLAVALRELAAA